MLVSHLIPNWSRRSTLIGAGLLGYVIVVALMIHAIVSLIPVQQWPTLTVRRPQPVAVTIGELALAVDRGIQNGATEPRAGDAETLLHAVRDRFPKPDARYLRALRNGSENLLWAPPGTVIAATAVLPSSNPIPPEPRVVALADGRYQDRHHSDTVDPGVALAAKVPFPGENHGPPI
jgi:hypothetical protein